MFSVSFFLSHDLSGVELEDVIQCLNLWGFDHGKPEILCLRSSREKLGSCVWVLNFGKFTYHVVVIKENVVLTNWKKHAFILTIFLKWKAYIICNEIQKRCTYVDFTQKHKYVYVTKQMTFHKK